MNNPKCLRCGTEMGEGFIMDSTQGAFLAARWVAGTPEPSFWTGTKITGKEKRKVATYRCPKCGYLESYAGELLP